ncbi:hypothetical protein DM52_1009 [Burkholderia mallei]|nr:hypothetical protein DM52_1009 [Burkholderia mallei]
MSLSKSHQYTSDDQSAVLALSRASLEPRASSRWHTFTKI